MRRTLWLPCGAVLAGLALAGTAAAADPVPPPKAPPAVPVIPEGARVIVITDPAVIERLGLLTSQPQEVAPVPQPLPTTVPSNVVPQVIVPALPDRLVPEPGSGLDPYVAAEDAARAAANTKTTTKTRHWFQCGPKANPIGVGTTMSEYTFLWGSSCRFFSGGFYGGDSWKYPYGVVNGGCKSPACQRYYP